MRKVKKSYLIMDELKADFLEAVGLLDLSLNNRTYKYAPGFTFFSFYTSIGAINDFDRIWDAVKLSKLTNKNKNHDTNKHG